MKRRLIFSLLFAVAVPGLSADEETVVKRPFLWKIVPPGESSGEIGKSSYLFGTIHVPHESVTTLHPLAQDAWNAADTAVFEIDFLEDREGQMKAISLPQGDRLEDLLSAELLQRLDARLKKILPQAGRSALPKAHVVVWPLLLGNLQAQARRPGQLSMDLKLYSEATAQGKKVGGLERPADQLNGLINLPLKDQIAFLQATLDAMDQDDTTGTDRLQLLISHYAEGDADKFQQFLSAEFSRLGLRRELMESVTTQLLTVRNRRMADEIVRRLRESPDQSFFFAVGAGHVVGDTSVQSFLKRHEFSTERVVPSAAAQVQEPSR